MSIVIGYTETYDARTGLTTRTPLLGDPVEVRAATAARLTTAIEAHIEQHFTQSQQRLLTAAYARGVGRGNGQAKRKAKIDTILDWIEAVTAHLFALQAQAEAATTIEALDAIQFNPSLFPPPAVTVKDVMTTPD